MTLLGPDPDPEVEAWLQRQLAKREPLDPTQRRHIAALFASEEADRVRRETHTNRR